MLYIIHMQPVLFTFCAGNELFFVSLYIVCFTEGYAGSVIYIMIAIAIQTRIVTVSLAEADPGSSVNALEALV